MALREEVEQHLAALSIEGNEAELVDDKQVGSLQALREATQLTLVSGLEHLANEVGGSHKAHVLATTTHLDADGDGEVGLAGANGADESEVLGVVDEGAGGDLPDDGGVDAVGGLEVELAYPFGELRQDAGAGSAASSSTWGTARRSRSSSPRSR
jgi:hypothetical protein